MIKLEPIHIFLLLTAASGLALGLTFKFAYWDEIVHYKDEMCFISACTILRDNCCNENNCYPCYSVTMTYNLYSNNTDTISKTVDAVVYYRNFCNQTNIQCYYDDRNIQRTLRIFDEYKIGFFMDFIMLSLIICTICFFIGLVFKIIDKKNSPKPNYDLIS